MSYTIELNYTPELMHRFALKAMRGFGFRSKLYTFIVILILLLLVLLLMLLLADMNSAVTGYRSDFLHEKLVWYVALVIIVFASVAFLTYWQVKREALKLIKKLDGKPIVMILTEDCVESKSGVGDSQMKWTLFERLSCYQDMWLLFNSNNTAFIIDKPLLTPELEAFLLKQAEEHGIKVESL